MLFMIGWMSAASAVTSSLITMVLVGLTDAANVLVLTPQTSYSHTNFFIPVVKELARRGHSVTYWNGLKPREEIDNVVQLYSQQLHDFNSNHHRDIGFSENNPLVLLLGLRHRMKVSCNMSYSDPVFSQLLQDFTGLGKDSHSITQVTGIL